MHNSFVIVSTFSLPFPIHFTEEAEAVEPKKANAVEAEAREAQSIEEKEYEANGGEHHIDVT